jgi:glycosyltransferase involved in cell wall biosynthesis
VIDHLDAGGAQALVFELATGIPGSCVLSLRGEPTESSYAWGRTYCAKSGNGRRWSIVRGIGALLAICLRERRRALFVAHLNASTLALCLLKPILRFRLLVMVHASPQQWPGWYRTIFRFVIRFADRVIGGGEHHRRLLVGEGVAPDRIVLVGIGSTLMDNGPRATDRDIRAELAIAPGDAILLNVARMVRGKGQAEIARAMAKLKRRKVTAVIIGDGPEEAHLNQLVAELGVADRVRFPGPRTDLHNFYNAATVFLMPCLDESMGVVILEALAYRLPIVAYDSGCIGEFIRSGENGFLVPRDVSALVGVIESVLDEHPVLRFDASEVFSMKAMVERFRQILALQGTMQQE